MMPLQVALSSSQQGGAVHLRSGQAVVWFATQAVVGQILAAPCVFVAAWVLSRHRESWLFTRRMVVRGAHPVGSRLHLARHLVGTPARWALLLETQRRAEVGPCAVLLAVEVLALEVVQ